MPETTEQRNYIRLENGCALTYKSIDSGTTSTGLCTSISGSGIFFTTDQAIDTGKALEIHFTAQSLFSRAMTAFIDVVRSTRLDKQLFEIDGNIKSIKTN